MSAVDMLHNINDLDSLNGKGARKFLISESISLPINIKTIDVCHTHSGPVTLLTAVSPHYLLCKQMHAQLKRLHEMEPTHIKKCEPWLQRKFCVVTFRPIFHKASKSPAVTGN